MTEYKSDEDPDYKTEDENDDDEVDDQGSQDEEVSQERMEEQQWSREVSGPWTATDINWTNFIEFWPCHS